MPTSYTATHFLQVVGSDDGTTFTWTAVGDGSIPGPIIDQNSDNDLDIDTDNYYGTHNDFTGFYYTASNGQTYPIFQNDTDPGLYFIPYNKADFDLFSDIQASGSLTDKSDDFVPTGVTVCFGAGTLIATSIGWVEVELLSPDTNILTLDGRSILLKWIGRQTVSTRFGPADRLMPVRFAAGSLGEGVPHSDLTVTADHGMLVDGVICHAGALVNGTTITRVPLAEMGESFTVYHIETEEHEIILANGAPAETFIDNVSRRVFDNFAEFETLYGDVPEMEELPYPRAMSVRQVPERIRAKLAGKAVA